MSDAVALRDQAVLRLEGIDQRLAELESERVALESERGDLLRQTGILADVIQRGRAGGLRDAAPAKDDATAPVTTEEGE